MTESKEIAEDLRFVRTALERRDGPRRPTVPHLVIWAIYSLICVPTYDFFPRAGLGINLAGLAIGFALSKYFGKRAASQSGEYDRAAIRRMLIHWYGGVGLIFAACVGMACVDPQMREVGVGQLSVILLGMLYFTAGVHMPDARFMRWVGPIIVLCGIGMGLIPHYRWTVTGAIFAICLISPIFLSRRAADLK
jgi:hypothetical protein